MGTWSEEIIQKIDSKLEGARDKEIRFFRIDEFKRNVARVDDFAATCEFCKNAKKSIEETVDTIDEAIDVPGKKRRAYDRLISRLSSHMQKQHKFYTPYYFSYLYAFFGTVGGLLLGYFLMKLVPADDWEMLSIGFAIGVIAAYIPGYYKDKQIRKEKRLM